MNGDPYASPAGRVAAGYRTAKACQPLRETRKLTEIQNAMKASPPNTGVNGERSCDVCMSDTIRLWLNVSNHRRRVPGPQHGKQSAVAGFVCIRLLATVSFPLGCCHRGLPHSRNLWMLVGSQLLGN